ncbi:Alpha-D-ribose 1-methylphosphonate 5-triphosphate synthase subunit PhnI [Pelagimonas phthalicica]|uniref:Alpha-D-ribose 1-methylphosphonate 5-triphosphate synthase subunit PhnI n=1 Tax=Pelagimonas phthalicica TaxID=1037362 RepID=A0A238JAB3_9RHOB|nr:carbon-phosphorus lyase complex subunit PhnI [Pelagimonas phthalicica]TDS93826.1 alpha-D-ribose 1-methylphosphonate 5-triphosphate synthase subunit PhnI [Pelagimonas phthalicica]SMX27650.1 Alpha-D-ribose 1-methylphosphonate 5-triphosphate synthase subunit PhnI [Pelagimonas phthalicica]
MAYVATRGGERAIEQSERLFREEIGSFDAQRVNDIRQSLPYLVDRVMGEASLYDEDLAALALAQTGGEIYEAVLLLRAWRTTQPRLTVAEPVEQGDLFTHRRISAAFKDIPGGQVLGPTLDYAHRILATDVLRGDRFTPSSVEPADQPAPAQQPSVSAWQAENDLVDLPEPDQTAGGDIPDLTREPLLFPSKRAHTLQSLARADTGGVLALGYAAMRGYGQAHPTVNELRLAEADITVSHPDGRKFSAGRVKVSQAEVVSKKSEKLNLGFAATFGWNEVKCISAATLDLNSGGAPKGSATEEEFFLYHTEGVESSGFCIHFKLPHYVTFQSSLDAMRDAKAKNAAKTESATSDPAPTKSEPAE